jgi:hypothetical protein
MLASYPPGSIAESFVPHLEIKDPNTGQYVNIKDVKESTFADLAKAKGIPTSLGDLTSKFNVPTSLGGVANKLGVPTSLGGVAGSLGVPTSAGGVASALGVPKLPTLPMIPKKGGTRKNTNIRRSSRRNRF